MLWSSLLTLLPPATAVPVIVEQVRVQGDLPGTDITAEVKGSGLFLYVRGHGTLFECHEATKDWWTGYRDVLAEAVQLLPSYPNADFGLAKKGFKGFAGSAGTGYCNMSVSSRASTIWLAFTHNDACFGSAGCVDEQVAIPLSRLEAQRLARVFSYYLSGTSISSLATSQAAATAAEFAASPTLIAPGVPASTMALLRMAYEAHGTNPDGVPADQQLTDAAALQHLMDGGDTAGQVLARIAAHSAEFPGTTVSDALQRLNSGQSTTSP